LRTFKHLLFHAPWPGLSFRSGYYWAREKVKLREEKGTSLGREGTGKFTLLNKEYFKT